MRAYAVERPKSPPRSAFVPRRRIALQRKCACCGAGGTHGERDCAHKKALQHHFGNDIAAGDLPPIVHEVLRSGGQPLDPATRAFMEPRLGHDFSRVAVYSPQSASGNLALGPAHDRYEHEADVNASRITSTPTAERRADFSGVRVHADSRAAESARALDASAYTVGPHIVFDAGKYAPDTREGKSLLAHELTHVLQQDGGDSEVLRRQPKGGEKEKPSEPPPNLAGCKDRLTVVQDAIKEAEALAKRALFAFERDYPETHEVAATKAHFGTLVGDQKATIIQRYKHVIANIGAKTYMCPKENRRVTVENEVVDICGQATCPGNTIVLPPVFGNATCPAGPVMLHEAIHNAGACDDIRKGTADYPPSRSEDNAYSYEHFAMDVMAGFQAPELGKRKPKTPKVKD